VREGSALLQGMVTCGHRSRRLHIHCRGPHARLPFTRTDSRDSSRCEQVLREGLSIADVRDRADIADRLADACEEPGRAEEAAEFPRQAAGLLA